MFAGCVNLTHLDIGNWDTTGVTDFTHMFGLKTTFDFTEQPSEDESEELASSASIQTLTEEASLSIKKQALFDAIDKIKKNGAKTTRSSFRELAQKTRLNSKGGFANNASNNGLKSLFGNLSNNNGFAKTLLNGIDKTSTSTLQSMSQTITDSSSADLLSLAAPNTSVYTITPYWNVEELAQIFNDLLETAGITDYQFSAESKYLHILIFMALQGEQFLTDADMEAMMASMKVSEREGLLNSYPDVIDYLTSTCQSITGNTEKVVGNTYANAVKILNDIYDYNYDPYSVWSLFRVYSLMNSSGMPQEFVDLIATASDEELVTTLRGMGEDMVEGADSIVDINAIESETFGLLAIPIKLACDLVEIAYGIKIDPTSAVVHSRLLLVVMMSAQGSLDQLPEGLFEMSDKDFVATLYGASDFNSLTEANKKDMVQSSFESKSMLDEYCFGPTMFTKSRMTRLVSLVCTGDENTLSPDDNYIYLKTMLAGEMGVLYTDEEIAQMSGAPVEELVAMDEQIKAEFETGIGPFYIKDGTEVEEDVGEEEEEVFDAQGTYYLRYLDMTGWTITADATTEGMIDGLTGLHVFKAPATCEQELGLAYEMVNLANLAESHFTLSSNTNGTTLVHAAIYAPEAGVDVGSDWFVIAAGILTMIVVLGGIVYLKKKKFVC